MTNTTIMPSIEGLKSQAKNLRAALAAEGDFISHSNSLELIARQFGVRDWNTLRAKVGNRPMRRNFMTGDRVSGYYLGQHFTGNIIGVRIVKDKSARLTLDFDEPVDVVTFDSFSSFRRRVTKIVRPNGISLEKTSDGKPHLTLMSV